MFLIWDIIAVLIIILLVYFGAKKGLIRTLVAVLCYFIAIIVAQQLAPKVSVFVFDNVIAKSIADTVQKSVANAVQNGFSVSNITSSLPSWLLGLIAMYYPDIDSLQLNFTEGQQALTDTVTMQITEALSAPLIAILSSIAFLLLFMLLSIVIKQVAKLFTGINRIPVLGSFNMFFGGVLGGVQAVLVLMVVCVAVNLINTILIYPPEFLSLQTFSSSFIMSTVCSFINLA